MHVSETDKTFVLFLGRERKREYIIINSSGSYNCWLNNILLNILKVVIFLQVIVVASAAAAAVVVIVVGLELI